MRNKLVLALFLCLIGAAFLSNKFFVLRQFSEKLKQNSSVHLPVDREAPAPSARMCRALLPNDDDSDSQPLVRCVIGGKTTPGDRFPNFWFRFGLHTDLASKPPAYILQSSLTL